MMIIEQRIQMEKFYQRTYENEWRRFRLKLLDPTGLPYQLTWGGRKKKEAKLRYPLRNP